MKTKGSLIAVLGLATTLMLGACDPIDDLNAEVSLGFVGGVAQFVPCETHEVDLVLVQRRNFGEREDSWQDLTHTEGNLTLEAGAPITADGADVRAGDTISVFLRSPQGRSLRAEFEIPEAGPTDGEWMRPNGEVLTEPCP